MKLPSVFQPLPWYAQAGLLVLGMAGTILMEYIQMERERNASSNEADDEDE